MVFGFELIQYPGLEICIKLDLVNVNFGAKASFIIFVLGGTLCDLIRKVVVFAPLSCILSYLFELVIVSSVIEDGRPKV